MLATPRDAASIELALQRGGGSGGSGGGGGGSGSGGGGGGGVGGGGSGGGSGGGACRSLGVGVPIMAAKAQALIFPQSASPKAPTNRPSGAAGHAVAERAAAAGVGPRYMLPRNRPSSAPEPPDAATSPRVCLRCGTLAFTLTLNLALALALTLTLTITLTLTLSRYLLATHLLAAGSSATVMNLSLLTSDFWSVVVGVLLLGSQLNGWYVP